MNCVMVQFNFKLLRSDNFSIIRKDIFIFCSLYLGKYAVCDGTYNIKLRYKKQIIFVTQFK